MAALAVSGLALDQAAVVVAVAHEEDVAAVGVVAILGLVAHLQVFGRDCSSQVVFAARAH